MTIMRLMSPSTCSHRTSLHAVTLACSGSKSTCDVNYCGPAWALPAWSSTHLSSFMPLDLQVISVPIISDGACNISHFRSLVYSGLAQARPEVTGSILSAGMADLRCSKCSSYLFTGPVQCSCGDRLCGDCYHNFKSRWAVYTANLNLCTIWSTPACMYVHVARRRYLTAPSVQKRYHWMNVSKIRQLRMSWRLQPSGALTKTAPGKDLESFIWYIQY